MNFNKSLPEIIRKVKYSKNDIDYREYYFLNKFLYLKKETSYYHRKIYFLNICISNKKQTNKIIDKNSYDLSTLFSFRNNVDTNNKVEIIIPIYNGYEYLTDLFNSIKSNTDLDYKLIVINDKSPDERIVPLLEKYKAIFGTRMQVINNNDNIGFVKSVNKALKISTENVILLNSDVIVPKNWASRLLAPIIGNSNIASVTPFSNAATCFSLPENFKDNHFTGNLQVVDDELSKLNINSDSLKFPTGVGFCMAINKKAIKDIGFLDEIFEKGYGEENDWCQRAIKNGYINAIAPNLFIWHKHGGSFNSEEKQKLVNNHLGIISRKYPEYNKSIENLIHNENYISIRFWAELLYMKASSQNIQVWFDHNCGGGTETYTYNKVEELKNEHLIIRIQNCGPNFFCITYFYKKYTNKLIITKLSDIEILIKQLMPNLIVVNNLASYKDIFAILNLIESLKKDLLFKVSFRGHDFQSICPSITMVNSENKYCNCNDITQCIECFSKFKTTKITINSINEWQTRWSHFINNVADDIIVFSNSTKEIFLRFYPAIQEKITIIPHKINFLRKVTVKPHKYFNIGVLGNIGVDKGALILNDMDKILPKYPNIKIKVIGTYNERRKNIQIFGKYEVKNLPDIVEKENIDLILIPSIWPETFSYTTEEAIMLGLPVACFDIGAPVERIKNDKHNLIIDKIDAAYALEKINEFYIEKVLDAD